MAERSSIPEKFGRPARRYYIDRVRVGRDARIAGQARSNVYATLNRPTENTNPRAQVAAEPPHTPYDIPSRPQSASTSPMAYTPSDRSDEPELIDTPRRSSLPSMYRPIYKSNESENNQEPLTDPFVEPPRPIPSINSRGTHVRHRFYGHPMSNPVHESTLSDTFSPHTVDNFDASSWGNQESTPTRAPAGESTKGPSRLQNDPRASTNNASTQTGSFNTATRNRNSNGRAGSGGAPVRESVSNVTNPFTHSRPAPAPPPPRWENRNRVERQEAATTTTRHPSNNGDNVAATAPGTDGNRRTRVSIPITFTITIEYDPVTSSVVATPQNVPVHRERWDDPAFWR
ncbi:uncharacterized protein F4822DRAFT_141169 [Hypoxylon trugodes]|uniref:uncharacterized protein n=1 Tax=Hypoxylon trugodes TaxID=326681 RepID=UPI0021969C35|nr:uncharacterized protein F4822DRAFT_141169 [Hypoxylon trugodes]KAI1392795.1 hypothetical protein F4822DRAFT_141169 [Hypoxylon trugodes]